MSNKSYGIIIRVKNLDVCRTFYRDVLGLGAPVMDSNFWVEFCMHDTMSLCLEKMEWEGEEPPSGSRIAWLLQVPNLDQFAKNMLDYGYQEEADSADRFGFKVKCYKDPEGNPFLVSSLRPRDL